MKARCPKCRSVYTFDSGKIPDKGVYGTCRKCQSHFLIRKKKLADNAITSDSTVQARTAEERDILKGLLYKGEVVESTVNSMDNVSFKKVITEGYEQKTLHLALTNLSLIIFSESNENTYYEKYLLDEIERIETMNCTFNDFSFITKNGERGKFNFDENSREALKTQIIPKVQRFVQGTLTQKELNDFKSLKASVGELRKMGNRMKLGKIVGGSKIISTNARAAIESNITPNEEILFCLVGNFKQTIVALKNRLLIVKPGFMAEATFGAKVTTFLYKDITGIIGLNTGLLQGVIEISAPSYPATPEKDWSSLGTDRDPAKVSNCLPINKMDLTEYRPYLEKLRALIANVKKTEMISQIEKLARLYQSGTFASGEFEIARKQVLMRN